MSTRLSEATLTKIKEDALGLLLDAWGARLPTTNEVSKDLARSKDLTLAVLLDLQKHGLVSSKRESEGRGFARKWRLTDKAHAVYK